VGNKYSEVVGRSLLLHLLCWRGYEIQKFALNAG